MNSTIISIKTGATFSLAQYSTTTRVQIKHFLHSFTPTSWIAQYMLEWCSAQSRGHAQWVFHSYTLMCSGNGDVSKCYTGLSGRSRISPRRGRQLPKGAPTYDFATFSQKLHEIERIWTPGGSFWENLTKWYVGAPWGVGARHIRHWVC